MKVTISDAVKYIGVDDKTIDLFESQYVVPEGVSYNSYLILDEKVALMDTVDVRGMQEWEKNLTEALGGRKVDYLVIQHLEPDHAGSIGRLLELYPDMKAQRRSSSPQTDSASSVHLMPRTRKAGHVRQEDITLILLVNMVRRYKHY